MQGLAKQADGLGRVAVERHTRKPRQRQRLNGDIAQAGRQLKRLAKALGRPLVLPGPKDQVAVLMQGHSAGEVTLARSSKQAPEPGIAVRNAIGPQPERDQRGGEPTPRVDLTAVKM